MLFLRTDLHLPDFDHVEEKNHPKKGDPFACVYIAEQLKRELHAGGGGDRGNKFIVEQILGHLTFLLPEIYVTETDIIIDNGLI